MHTSALGAAQDSLETAPVAFSDGAIVCSAAAVDEVVPVPSEILQEEITMASSACCKGFGWLVVNRCPFGLQLSGLLPLIGLSSLRSIRLEYFLRLVSLLVGPLPASMAFRHSWGSFSWGAFCWVADSPRDILSKQICDR
jgi:hypothetical protein